MEPDADQVPEEIIDGIRIATAVFSGLEKKQTALILLPGASVDHLPGGYAVWADPLILPQDEMTLPHYIIWVDSDEISYITSGSSQMSGRPSVEDYLPVVNLAITATRKALFDKATGSLLGMNYTPIAYLGPQAAEGANHSFLCEAETMYLGTQPKFVIIYLYKDPQGNVSLLKIADYDTGEPLTFSTKDPDVPSAVDNVPTITGRFL